ncbi:MAG: isocitrate dehydrogenase [Phototrophicales bacterium]|nr:MAG: isocitrate dehydrogenase [Phototrophicales bacterium]
MTYQVVLIGGDGIGQEVIAAAHRVLAQLNLPLKFVEAEAGFGVFQRVGTALPNETLAICERSDAILFGATSSPMEKVKGYLSPILQLRRHFDLFANLRPALHGAIDVLVVRENTEGLYSGIERIENNGQTAITERRITAYASQRIVEVACQQSMQRRRKLTIVHKANVLKETCGLFRRVALEVVSDFPELEVEEMLVDTAAMRLVQQPSHFDVLVTTNLFGDILSDLLAGLCGGLGIAPSANIGNKRPALFEPVHGSAPDIAGKGVADPRAAILSGAMMLHYLGFCDIAKRLQTVTYAVSHTGNTQATTDAIIERLEQGI